MGICGPTQIKICRNCTHVNYKLQSTTNDHFVQFVDSQFSGNLSLGTRKSMYIYP